MLRSALIAAALVATVAFAGEDPSGAYPGVSDLDESNFEHFVGKEKAVLVEFYAPWCGHCKNLAPEWGRLGAAVEKSPFKNKILIAKVDANTHRALGERFKVEGFPTIKYFAPQSLKAEEYSGGRDLDSFVKFINEKAGTNLRIPKEPSSVVDLDPRNFDAIVMDKNKDVLVEFYAPWCGHCKKLAPDYEIVGKTYAGDANVVIAKVDANEEKNKALASRFGVTGFPTLKWFPKDNKEGEDYNEGRQVSDFVAFLNKNTGAQRVAGGMLTDDAGTDKKLSDLAGDYMAADAAGRAAALASMEERVKELNTEDSKQYVSTVAKIVEKGDDFVEKESARLRKMIEGNVKIDKRDKFQKRLNVLSAFKK